MVENEIPFLSWSAFRQMAPSIIRLEITRLERLADALRTDAESYNALVRARLALKRFVSSLGEAEKETVERACADYLRTAILTLSLLHTDSDEEVTETIHGIVDRIQYVYHRMALIY